MPSSWAVVRTSDVDIFILLHHADAINLVIYLDTGTRRRRQLVNITELATSLGQPYCSTLLGYYVFSETHLATMSELEKCMESLIKVFHHYAAGDGDMATLTKKEFKQLMETELSSFLASQKSPDTVDKIMTDLDLNKDKKLDFGEFVTLIVGLTTASTVMSRLEQLILSMVDLFEEYAGQDGEIKTISKDELKQLIEKEVSKPELKEKIHADDIGRAMDLLDKNHDGDVNFNEFSRCVATLARGYYKSGKGGKKNKSREENK
ncbi:unnamed protein product [Merluccius merluccius]